ncbi:MAG: DUF4397 domain-containing protein [Aestuariibacter sp.]
MIKRVSQFAFLSAISGLTLFGCGGSSSSASDDYPESYLQFYNGSPNSPSVQMYAEDEWLGTSSFGDATTLFSLDSGDTDIELYWEDADGQDTLIDTETLNLRDGHKTMLFVSGDFAAPDVTSLQFERSSLDDEFYLYTGSLIADSSYDLYISEEGATFEQAQFISNLNYLDFEQARYWDADDDEFAFPEDEYVIYLTQPGSDTVLFESQSINFAYASDYTLVVRTTTGANENNLVADIILNSTNITANQDVNATSQVRVYSALAAEQTLDIELTASEEQTVSLQISGGEMSGYQTVTFGDYQVTGSITGESQRNFDNRLLTLNQGISKTLVVFQDDEQQLTSIEMVDSTLPQSFEHEINVANLLSEFNDVDIYFVRNDETKDTAQYKMTGLDYAESRSIVLPNDYYSIVAVYEDALGIESLLYRSEIIDFTQDDIMMLSVEKNLDQGSGYLVRVID